MKVMSYLNQLFDLVRRHPVWTAGVAVVFVLLLLLMGGGGEETPDTAYYEVKRGDLTVSIVEGGTLESVNEVVIRNEVEGTSRIIYIVPEGSYVKQGDLLVELDSMQAQDQLNQQEINYEKAQFALLQAEQELEIQKSLVDSDVRKAELDVLFAEMDLEKYLEGEAKVEMLTASNDITKTEAQLSIDRDTLKWSEELQAKGFETKNVLDRDRLSVTNQELALAIQKMRLWMIKNYDFERRKTELESNVTEAEKDLERVKQQGQRKLAQFAADLTTQSNTLSLNLAKLERDRKNLEATKILAPQDGLVVYRISESRFSSESMIEEGATVRNRQELIKLPDTSTMKVTVKVHESHVNMVKPGQAAFVVLDSIPDERFSAVVDRVALLPDATSRFGNPNLKVYKTEVVITDRLPDIKPGVSARAEIIITNIPNALSVPIQAVTTHKGKQVAYKKVRGDDVPVPVQIGLFNTRFIEVVSGLEEGDRVLLSPPFDTQEKDIEGAILGEGEAGTLTNAPARPPSGRSQEGRPGQQSMGEGRPRGDGPGEGRQDPGTGGDRRQQFEAMRQQFDKDGDGELNEAERQAMREEMQQRFGGGAGGGGRGQGGGRPQGPGGGGGRPPQ